MSQLQSASSSPNTADNGTATTAGAGTGAAANRLPTTYLFLKRLFDLLFAALGLLLLSPLWLVLALWIKLDSKGPVFFQQQRVGKDARPFWMYKFRTMIVGAEQHGKQLTVGADPRITRSGRFLRRYKLDEFPQLLNVLRGDMSLVGPRPEVPRYVACYLDHQKPVLAVRPGLTDWASIKYSQESELLAAAASVDDAEQLYVEQILPDKLQLNLEYIAQASLLTDMAIIAKTIMKIIA